jgi:hypothetical protein
MFISPAKLISLQKAQQLVAFIALMIIYSFGALKLTQKWL